MITFAGIPVDPPPGSVEAVARWYHSHRLDPFEYQGFLVSGVQHLPTPYLPLREAPRVGVLCWPAQVDRFATCFLVASLPQTRAIRAAVGTSPTAKTLALADGANTVTADMYLIGVMPVSQRGDGAELNLLLLVDARYFWWQSGAASVSASGSWETLFTDLFDAVGAAATQDAVPAAYLTPNPAVWDVGVQPIPPLIWAAAMQVGLRAVRLRSGAVQLQSYATAAAADESRWTAVRYEAYAGGQLSGEDVARGLPASVDTVFLDGSSYNTTLASLSLAEASGVTGVAARKGVIKALPAAPTVLEAAAYAAQAAEDYYSWAFAYTDVTLRGLLNVEPCGLDDSVEWVHAPDGLVTRILRSQWSDRNIYGSEPASAADGEAPEYRDECLNGYKIRKRATLTLGADGLTQTEYVFDTSYGVRCFEAGGSGGGGGGSGGGGGGSGGGTTTVGPTGYQDRLEVVTNVCISLDSGSGVSGVTVEKTTILLPPGSVLDPPVCVVNPEGCCSGSGLDPCCDGADVLTSLAFAVVLPLGADEIVIDGTLSVPEGASGSLYYLLPEALTYGGFRIWVSVFCDDGWYAEGDFYQEGAPASVYYRVELQDYGTYLLGEVAQPDGGDPVLLVIEKPCPSDYPVETECEQPAEDCGCSQISAVWDITGEGIPDNSAVTKLAVLSCLFRSHDNLFTLQGTPSDGWALTHVDGREWYVQDWDCCAENAMDAVVPGAPGVTLSPVYVCCTVGPDLDCMGTVVVAPGTLVITWSGCTGSYAALNGTSITLVYNGVQWEAASPAPFDSVTVVLSDPGSSGTLPTFLVTLTGCWDDASGLQPTTCDPFLIENNVAPVSGTCGTPGPGDNMHYEIAPP